MLAKEKIGFCTMFGEFRACTLGGEGKTIMVLLVLQSFCHVRPQGNAPFHINSYISIEDENQRRVSETIETE